MRSIIFSLTMLWVAILMIGCTHKEPEVIKIGCSTPLSGADANYGRSTKQGIDLAIAELNKAEFLTKHLEVIFEDDKMDPRTGVNAVKKLIDVDKVSVILGPFGSSVVLACAPVANQNKTIIISASATADAIADAGDYVFRITPPNSKQGRDIADFCISKLKVKKGAIIFQNNDYGITLKDAFQTRFTELGGKMVAVESAEGGTSSFRSQLSKFKTVNPDVIFLPLHYRESGLLLKQARELGMKAKFISADGAMTEDMLKIAGDAAEGTYYSTLALGYGVSDSLISQFTQNFKDFYNGQEPDIYAAYYYEVTKIIATAIKRSGYNPDKIRDYLYSKSRENSFNGITGVTSFDNKGEVNKPFYIYTVRQGRFERTSL